MTISAGLVSLALLFAYLFSKIIGEVFKENLQNRRLERSKKRSLNRSLRKAKRVFRSEQALLKKTKKKAKKKAKKKTKKKAKKKAKKKTKKKTKKIHQLWGPKKKKKKKKVKKAILCPKCDQKLTIPRGHIGSARCPKCKSTFNHGQGGVWVEKVVPARDSKGRFATHFTSPQFAFPPNPIPGLRREDISGDRARLPWAIKTYTTILIKEYKMPEERAKELATAYYEGREPQKQEINCPTCGMRMRSPPSALEKVRCPSCDKQFFAGDG